jgi:hypothetical protein
MSEAIVEYQEYGQQPTPLIAGSALGATSLAVQGLVDVARDRKLVGPSSLYITIVGISGERKTASDREFVKPIRQCVTEEREKKTPAAAASLALVAAWEAERDGLLTKIKSSSGGGTGKQADIKQFKERLGELYDNKPKKEILPTLFYEDVNPESLAVEFAEGWPSAALWSDEAGLIVGSRGMGPDSAMRFIGLLNRLWDGGDFDRHRTTAKSVSLQGRRFTVCEAMQPVVLALLLSLCEGAARKMGLLARHLLAWPASTIGDRPYQPPSASPAMTRFHKRLLALLDKSLPKNSKGVLSPSVLHMTPSAFELWREHHNAVEAALKYAANLARSLILVPRLRKTLLVWRPIFM